MFKRAGNTLKPHLRSLHSKASASSRKIHPGVVVSSAVLATSVLWYSNTKTIHSDAPSSANPEISVKLPAVGVIDVTDPDTLHAVIWGSNRSKVLAPDLDSTDSIRTPAVAVWLDNVALRDLALHRDHAACVDARGDVYQWGDGFFGSDTSQNKKPKLTLKGKNITKLQLTDSRLYALSASGKVYAFAANSSQQTPQTGTSTPSSTWWGTGWLWGEQEEIDFVELTPTEHLAWGESFVSLAAGNDHLLAVTSAGRTYAHPVNKKANAYGQLGFRKIEITGSTSALPQATSHLHAELIPKSLADPFAKSTSSTRATSTPSDSDSLEDVDDSTIRFCPHLMEIPVLRGVEVAQVAAGSRSSFARTTTGRVLGWGANEYGQIGLGSNVVLDTITVPTEVVLWRAMPSRTRTKCLDVSAGGDLTAFTVECSEESSKVINLLMCGNGQWGGLGNNVFSNAQGAPTRARNVSGLLEYSDKSQSLQPIIPQSVAVSPTGHVLLTLDTSASSRGVGGKDLVAWGKNYESELGNGKKASIPVPTALNTSDGQRFMLRTQKAKEVRDLRGNVWKHNVKVQQRAVVGYGNSAVYWKIS